MKTAFEFVRHQVAQPEAFPGIEEGGNNKFAFKSTL